MEVLGLLGFIFALIAHSKVNEVRRELRRMKRDGQLGGGEVDPELYEDVDRLRAEVSEMQERLDFTERLLVSHRNERDSNSESDDN